MNHFNRMSIFISFLSVLWTNIVCSQHVITLWENTSSSSLWTLANDIEITDSSVFLAGNLNGTSLFGSKNTGIQDFFIAELTTEGVIKWIKTFNNDTYNHISSIKKINNRLIVCGYFKDSIILKGVQFVSKNKISAFIFSTDLEGNFLWANTINGNYLGEEFHIQTYKGKIFIAGTYIDSLVLDKKYLSVVPSIFLATYDLKGQIMTSISSIGTDISKLNDMQLTSEGELLLVGEFKDTFTFLGNKFVSKGGTDGFFIKLDTINTTLISKQIGSVYYDNVSRVLSREGDIILAGNYSEKLEEYLLVEPKGGFDIYLLKLSDVGAKIWSNAYGSNTNDYVEGLSLNHQGSVYISSTSNSFPYHGLIHDKKNPQRISAIYLTKFNNNGNFSFIDTINSYGVNNNSRVVCDVTGNIYLMSSHAHSNSDSILKKTNHIYDFQISKLFDCDNSLNKIRLPNDSVICEGSFELSVLNPENSEYLIWNTGDTSKTIIINQSDDYWVKALDKYGCFSTDTMKLIVNKNPTFDLDSSCFSVSNRYTLITGPNEMKEYSWNNGSSLPAIIISNNNFEKIKLSVIDKNNCTGFDELYLQKVEFPQNQPFGIEIFPNPTFDNVHIYLNYDFQKETKISIIIFDDKGLIIKSFTDDISSRSKIIELPLSGIEPGNYNGIIKINNEYSTFKIIKL